MRTGAAGLRRALQCLRESGARRRRRHGRPRRRRATSSRTISSRCASCRRCTPTAITPAPTASSPAITRPKSPARASRPTDYKVPLYSVPAKLAGKKSTVFSQYDRKEIEKGALAGKGLEICWVKDPVDAFFAQIQGSTRVKLDDGELLRLNYIASNGKPYTPVGRLLIDAGHLHARRNVDGQDPRIHGSQPGRGQGAAREEPLLRVLLRDAARARTTNARRAGHPADAGALARGRSLDPRLRHADLDRRQISDHQRRCRRTPSSI